MGADQRMQPERVAGPGVECRDTVDGNAPLQLDDVSATIDGRPAVISYISPTQLTCSLRPTLSPELWTWW